MSTGQVKQDTRHLLQRLRQGYQVQQPRTSLVLRVLALLRPKVQAQQLEVQRVLQRSHLSLGVMAVVGWLSVAHHARRVDHGALVVLSMGGW